MAQQQAQPVAMAEGGGDMGGGGGAASSGIDEDLQARLDNLRKS